MSENMRFGFGSLETLQFLWTNKKGVFLHRKWGKEIPKKTASIQHHQSRTSTKVMPMAKLTISVDEQGMHVGEHEVWVREP